MGALHITLVLAAPIAISIILVWHTKWQARRRARPEVFTEGKPLKLPRREGDFIRVFDDTEAGSCIELDGETFFVTRVDHDGTPAGCRTYAKVAPFKLPPTRWDRLMEDET